MSAPRPDPDTLLRRLQDERDRQLRGKLKVFLGASPGVGKTFSMLEAAQAKRADGLDVVVGIVETHGRTETARLVEGLEVLPRRTLEYRGTRLEEFDLDGAIARHPALLLVDELAHSNAPGSRHAKRWQDVEELLARGINVYTTLNVQHIESLNDVVAQITGVQVRETLPDSVLEQADEIELVDVTADVLQQRLREGKVYVPDQASRAIERFFRKGNLIALRELALRRTAERVDAQMRGYMAERGIRDTWAAGERLLVCIGPGRTAARLVRATRRMAARLHADWVALYVETPRDQRLSAADREEVAARTRVRGAARRTRGYGQRAERRGRDSGVRPGAQRQPDRGGQARTLELARLAAGVPARRAGPPQRPDRGACHHRRGGGRCRRARRWPVRPPGGSTRRPPP